MGEVAWAALDGRALPGWYLGVLAAWTLAATGVTWLAQARHHRAVFG
jgi:hypothetical protein